MSVLPKRNNNNGGISLYIKGIGRNPINKKAIKGLNRSVDVKTAYNFFNVVIKDKHDGITVGKKCFHIKVDLREGLDKLSNFYESLFKIGYAPIKFYLYDENDSILYQYSYLRGYIHKQIKRYNPSYVILDITYRYGPVIETPPEFIYFLVNNKHIDFIKKYGIFYDIKYKIGKNSFRIHYMTNNKSYNDPTAYKIAKRNKWDVSSIKVSTKNIEGFFYKDFNYSNNFLYIHSPVKPDDIVEIKKLSRIHFLKPHKLGRKPLYYDTYKSISNSETPDNWSYDNQGNTIDLGFNNG